MHAVYFLGRLLSRGFRKMSRSVLIFFELASMNMCNVLYTFIAAEVEPLMLVQFIVYLKEFIISY